jgi:Spx/MgsR family transcriptional regulator
MIHIYGIPNCDTVKKTLDWCKQQKLDYTFHDFKKEDLPQNKLKVWSKAIGLDILLNKKSTTWRGLTQDEQVAASTENGALALMKEKTSVIKRPVVEWMNGKFTAGFDETKFSSFLK